MTMPRKARKTGRPPGGNLDHLKGPFLEALRVKHFVTQACDLAGVGRSAVYEWRESDPDFAKAMDEVKERMIDMARAEAFRRAHDGVDEPVTVAGGREVVKRYSDGLLAKILQAHDPAFRENAGAAASINVTFVQLVASRFLGLVQRFFPVACPKCGAHLEGRKQMANELSRLDAIEMTATAVTPE